MHDQTSTFQLLLLGELGKSQQQVSDVLIIEIYVHFFALMDCLIPLDEEHLIVLVYISEVTYSHSLELLLDLAHIAITVLIRAVWVQGPEDVHCVEVLTLLAFCLLAAFREESSQDLAAALF